MIITLCIPPAILSPNKQSHWAVKARRAKKYRAEARIAAIAAFNELGVDPPRFATASIKCRFYYRNKARRDADNSMASIKSGIDGLTDAGVWIDDSGVTWLPVELLHDPRKPRLEIEIEGNH